MKTLILILLLVTGFAYAGFKLPTSAYQTTEIAEAETKAKTNSKPITFLISNTESNCPLCDNASEAILKELKAKTVVVYARTREELPEKAKALLQGKDTGKYIPYAFVVDNNYEKLLGIVQYESIKKDGPKAFREVEAAIRGTKTGQGGTQGGSSLDAFKARQP